MVLVNETASVEREHHEVESCEEDAAADGNREEVTPYFLEKGHVLLSLAGDPGLAHPRALTIDEILKLRPLVTVASLFASSSPLLAMFPLRHEDHAPDHYDKGVEEICGAVIRCELEHLVVERR